MVQSEVEKIVTVSVPRKAKKLASKILRILDRPEVRYRGWESQGICVSRDEEGVVIIKAPRSVGLSVRLNPDLGNRLKSKSRNIDLLAGHLFKDEILYGALLQVV